MNDHSTLCWFKGRAKRRTTKLKDGNTAHIQFSTQDRPLGSELELPEGRSTTTIDHSDCPIGVKVVIWSRDNNGKAVSYEDIDAFLDGKHEVSGAKFVGDAQVIAEGAVRKKSDGEGSEVEEHRFTLRVAFDDKQAFSSTPLGMLLSDKAFVLSVSPAQVSLPAMPAKKPVGRPKKDVAQLRLGEKVDADEDTSPPDNVVQLRPAPVAEPEVAEDVQDAASAPEAAPEVSEAQAEPVQAEAHAPEPTMAERSTAATARKSALKFSMVDREKLEDMTPANWLDESLQAHGNDVHVTLAQIGRAMGMTVGMVRNLVEADKERFGLNPNATVFSRKQIRDYVTDLATASAE